MQNNASPPNRPKLEQQVFTIAEVAQIVGKHPSTVYRKLYAGELNVCPSFGRLNVTKAELDKLLGVSVPYNPIRRTRKVAK